MKISQFTYKEIQIEITYTNGFLAYTFQYEGNPYGSKVTIPSKKVIDVASTTALLILNAIETYETLLSDRA